MLDGAKTKTFPYLLDGADNLPRGRGRGLRASPINSYLLDGAEKPSQVHAYL